MILHCREKLLGRDTSPVPKPTQVGGCLLYTSSRVEVEAAAQFIHDALAQDVPVAFLNRHKGKEKALYTWHWVPIHKIFMDGDDIRCGIFDEGEIRDFSLANWMKDTILGGGFCYISRKG